MEGREPPHIHVAHAGRYAKFWLEPVSVADVRGFRAHEMTEIRDVVMENADLFLEKWHEYFGGKS
jgi:protein involved in temperature-dependent protein secretion